MAERVYNVLFLCTSNTARSILAEGILRNDGAGRFNAYSAGSQPKGTINHFALNVLASYDYPASGYSSKPGGVRWTGGAANGLCVYSRDSAAGEACPIWPGHPATAHWGIEGAPQAQERKVRDELTDRAQAA